MKKRAPQHKKVCFFRFCAMLLHCFPAVFVIVISDSTKERSCPTPFYFVALGIPLRVRVEMANGWEVNPRRKNTETEKARGVDWCAERDTWKYGCKLLMSSFRNLRLELPSTTHSINGLSVVGSFFVLTPTG